MQREEPFAAGRRTHGERHQADIRSGSRRHLERQQCEGQLSFTSRGRGLASSDRSRLAADSNRPLCIALDYAQLRFESRSLTKRDVARTPGHLQPAQAGRVRASHAPSRPFDPGSHVRVGTSEGSERAARWTKWTQQPAEGALTAFSAVLASPRHADRLKRSRRAGP